jgi:peptidyl-prolyl cis-trans isomerase A (cyclophilin A)
MNKALPLMAAAAACLVLAGCSSSKETATAPETPAKQETAPVKKAQAPDVYKINFDTSKGPVVVEVHRDWAPIGADHLYELVQAKFYDGDRFFRVLKGFVVQFGLNGDPDMNSRWAHANIPDDPVKEHNTKGTLTYATAGPATRSSQLFINLADNTRLDSDGFAPLGKVITGMDVVESLYAGYGEGSPQGEGPDQTLVEKRGNDYLTQHFPKLDYIKTATIQQ